MNLFGGGGSSKGGPQNVNIPAFTSEGGITPEQQALADFTYGQNLLGEANAYGTSGLGQSTMATQGAEGAATGRAQQMGQMSDINTGAEYGAYQNQVANLEQGLQNQQTLNQLAQQNQAGTDLASGFQTGAGLNTQSSTT
jgi:hypothetical protein